MTADLVQGVAGEFDDVKRIEDHDRVGQLVANGVGVATERIQGGVLDRARKSTPSTPWSASQSA